MKSCSSPRALCRPATRAMSSGVMVAPSDTGSPSCAAEDAVAAARAVTEDEGADMFNRFGWPGGADRGGDVRARDHPASGKEAYELGHHAVHRRAVLAAVRRRWSHAPRRVGTGRSRSRPPGSPSPDRPGRPQCRPRRAAHGEIADSIGGPPVRLGSTPASIASKIEGTPAITCTLPSVKPGAAETGLSIRVAPSGTRAMRQTRGVSAPAPSGRNAPGESHARRHGYQAARPSPSATASAVMSSWVGPMPPEVKR